MSATRLSIAISVIIAFYSNLAIADAESFERAVSVYLKGFEECVEAHTLRGRNIEAAKNKYQLYLNYKDEATAIDKSILNSPARDMQKNLRYCEKVYGNILRAEALPILEKGIAACEEAKVLLKEGNSEAAKERMDIYNQYKTEALVSTESVLEIYSVASKVRLCSRIESKIAKKEEEKQKLNEAAQLVVASLSEATKQCDIANNIVNSPSFDIKDLAIAKRTLKQVVNKQKEASANKVGLSTLELFPEAETTTQINTLMAEAKGCAGKLNPAIAKVERKQAGLVQTISTATGKIEQGIKQCKTGESLLTNSNFQFSDLNKVQWYLDETNKVRSQIKANGKAVNAANSYKNWKSSKKFNAQYSNLNNCSNKIAKLLDNKQKAMVAIKKKEQEAQAKAAKEAQEKEQQRLAALEAQRAEEERLEAEAQAAREQAATEAEAQTDAEAQAEEEALAGKTKREQSSRVSRSWLDLIPDQQRDEDDEELDEDLDDEDLDDSLDSGSGAGRSWTDLIPQR